MGKQKIFLHSNLRYLRKRLKISQEELAEKLNFISRSKVTHYENGNVINPPLDELFTFADFFKMTIDTLLKVDLTKLGELKLRELEAGNDVYLTGKNVRVLAITVDKKNNESVEYVPVKSQAGYLSGGFSDPDFIGELPKYSIPGIPKNGTYRIFTIDGDSMLPLKSGTDVVGQYVEDWSKLKADTPCHVIIKGEATPVFKLFTLQENRKVLLRSLNKQFTPYKIDAGDVLEVWKFYSYISNQFPEAEADIAQLTNSILELKKEIRQLAGHK